MNPADMPRGYYYGGLYLDGKLFYPYVGKNVRFNPYSDLCFVQQTVYWRDGFSVDEMITTQPMHTEQVLPWKQIEWEYYDRPNS